MFKINGNLRTATIDGVNNVVTGVDWICTATTNLATAQIQGSVEFEYNPESPFVEYENLNEDVVVGWVTSKLGTDAISFYEEKAQTAANEYSEESPEKETVLYVTCFYQEPVSEQTPPWQSVK